MEKSLADFGGEELSHPTGQIVLDFMEFSEKLPISIGGSNGI